MAGQRLAGWKSYPTAGGTVRLRSVDSPNCWDFRLLALLACHGALPPPSCHARDDDGHDDAPAASPMSSLVQLQEAAGELLTSEFAAFRVHPGTPPADWTSARTDPDPPAG